MSDELLNQVLLSELSDAPFTRPSDLDDWLTQLYEYYYHKGFSCIFAGKLLNISSVIFTLVFSAIFLVFIDWRALWSCTPHCGETVLFRADAHSDQPFYLAVVACFLTVLSAYCLHCTCFFVYDTHRASAMYSFVNKSLGISEQELATIEWQNFTAKLLEFQEKHQGRFFLEPHNEHDIVSRIMRKDNYLIALLDHPDKLIVPTLPLPLFNTGRTLTKTLKWIVTKTILDMLFKPNYDVNENFLEDHQGLRRRLWWAGLCNLILAPFIIFFLFIYTFLSNAEQIHRDPSTLGSRCWSTYSEWKIREYNQLPHEFRRRLANSLPWANKYVEQFRSPFISILARFLSFVLGSFLAVLVLLGLINEDFMDVRIWDRNLWWFLGVFGTALAWSRTFIISTHTYFEPAKMLSQVTQETHYMPKRWRSKAHKIEVYNEFAELFPYKVTLFVQEVLGVFVTPFVLWFYIAPNSEKILEFLQSCTVKKDAVGSICTFADFRFERHGNPRFGGLNPEQEAPPKNLRSRGGKLERSFINFMVRNPSWRPSKQGEVAFQEFLHNLRASRVARLEPGASFHGAGSYVHPGGNPSLGAPAAFGAAGTEYPGGGGGAGPYPGGAGGGPGPYPGTSGTGSIGPYPGTGQYSAPPLGGIGAYPGANVAVELEGGLPGAAGYAPARYGEDGLGRSMSGFLGRSGSGEAGHGWFGRHPEVEMDNLLRRSHLSGSELRQAREQQTDEEQRLLVDLLVQYNEGQCGLDLESSHFRLDRL
mmetsp:Transcript_28753/g.66354  ORF Transcript_28753/g.66354 Transcript_28753/m.66354 type:complete len:759 (-) Transcript_28753:221-2497(-)|eukprot:CAMPEP_0114548610 /NCGR_PEP_ID=MMETSP0114-20121206/5076_1 /TAXON_ID=31324 /ORGANISM="Goniomonas sp, Strain m" /LENGTH=758 /DNA_ID=CAMNT_0001733217 /DNA_START=58 /DNA_END=2334 /DNA_ORIENTATION=+